MSRRGWAGVPPESQDEGGRRILEATARCVKRLGAEQTTLAAVAEESGISRRTIYRYFDGIEDLFAAVGRGAMDDFQTRLDEATAGLTDVVTLVVESLAFAIEEVPRDPLLHLLVATGHMKTFGQIVMSPLMVDYCRRVVVESKADWAALGYDEAALNDLIVFMQRILQSFLVAPEPALEPPELRAFLRRWLGPAVLVRGQWRPTPGDTAR
ncbi:TetR/AcrR family transcriptional regulator [Nocardia bovistercoris]|uniref:TetR/AcrR family transcriptional regulator n=1 Tax=Nocardia bovistercoris TaxID=2785916 RepID=A0A931IE29_9NOCA|nr:TetR/AcrR family transcriptional regulator [Nocardia bovistercoris]MBH0779501.1 TetR/AcrR family transcriptional regulator [Nocardia bovistercoris]